MQQHTNELGQPVGAPVPDWTPPPRPERAPLDGRFCRVEPLHAAAHAASLHEANRLDADGRTWTYLAYGPFETLAAYRAWAEAAQRSADPLFFAVVDRRTERAVGIASYLRIDPANGSIEIGHLHFSPLLQRTPAATEALFLLMDQAFRLGYRRLEWKCNALNAASCRAAARLGLRFEGVFRQATVVKGRNRDTAWYAAIDRDWPALRAAFVRWLAPANFTDEDLQIQALSDLTAPLLKDTK
ncbi:MAG TPA: GNAT family protein [Chthonomonadaceae bacterium]|nr:GNAT family protein [Chthonomonadaceae bacterium]